MGGAAWERFEPVRGEGGASYGIKKGEGIHQKRCPKDGGKGVGGS